MAKDDNRALERLLQEIDKLSDEQFTKFMVKCGQERWRKIGPACAAAAR